MPNIPNSKAIQSYTSDALQIIPQHNSPPTESVKPFSYLSQVDSIRGVQPVQPLKPVKPTTARNFIDHIKQLFTQTQTSNQPENYKPVVLCGRDRSHVTIELLAQETSLSILRLFDYSLNIDTFSQAHVGNCWIVAVLKAVMDSPHSNHIISNMLRVTNTDNVSFSFPSSDPSKRQLILGNDPTNKADDPTTKYDINHIFSSSDGLHYLLKGISDIYYKILQEHKTNDPRFPMKVDEYKAIKNGNFSQIMNGWYSAEVLYHIYKYLTHEFTSLLAPTSIDDFRTTLERHYNDKTQSVGVIAFKRSFESESFSLSNQDFPSNKIIPRHAYFIKSVSPQGIVTILNPHDTASMIHLSFEDVYNNFSSINLARLITQFKQPEAVDLSRSLPMFITNQGQRYEEHFNHSAFLNSYFPSSTISLDGENFLLYRSINGDLEFLNTTTNTIVQTHLKSNENLYDSDFQNLTASVIYPTNKCLAVTYHQGYVIGESISDLHLQSPSIKIIPRNSSYLFNISNYNSISFQLFLGSSAYEFTIVNLSDSKPEQTYITCYSSNIKINGMYVAAFLDIQSQIPKITTENLFPDQLQHRTGLMFSRVGDNCTITTTPDVKALVFIPSPKR